MTFERRKSSVGRSWTLRIGRGDLVRVFYVFRGTSRFRFGKRRWRFRTWTEDQDIPF